MLAASLATLVGLVAPRGRARSEHGDDAGADRRLRAWSRRSEGRSARSTLGGRELPPWFSAVVALMAPALFAALVVTQALADGRDLGVGADTAGVALAGAVAWRGGSVIAVVTVAAVTAAALRALG